MSMSTFEDVDQQTVRLGRDNSNRGRGTVTTTYSQKFLDEHRHFNVAHIEWWDAIYDDFAIICDILGIDLDRLEPSFSGFCCQGSGASFTGFYCSGKSNSEVWTYDTAPQKIRQHAPSDDTLHVIADRLCFLNRLYTPLYAKISRSRGYLYVHETTMVIAEWEFLDGERNEDVPAEISEHIEGELLDVFRDLARWLYSALETEYDYLTSDEAVAESLEANEIHEEGEDECSL